MPSDVPKFISDHFEQAQAISEQRYRHHKRDAYYIHGQDARQLASLIQLREAFPTATTKVEVSEGVGVRAVPTIYAYITLSIASENGAIAARLYSYLKKTDLGIHMRGPQPPYSIRGGVTSSAERFTGVSFRVHLRIETPAVVEELCGIFTPSEYAMGTTSAFRPRQFSRAMEHFNQQFGEHDADDLSMFISRYHLALWRVMERWISERLTCR